MTALTDLIAELRRQLAREQSEDFTSCARCGCDYYCDDETEPSSFCHNCAHDVAERLLPDLLDAAETSERREALLREALNELRDTREDLGFDLDKSPPPSDLENRIAKELEE